MLNFSVADGDFLQLFLNKHFYLYFRGFKFPRKELDSLAKNVSNSFR